MSVWLASPKRGLLQAGAQQVQSACRHCTWVPGTAGYAPRLNLIRCSRRTQCYYFCLITHHASRQEQGYLPEAGGQTAEQPGQRHSGQRPAQKAAAWKLQVPWQTHLGSCPWTPLGAGALGE